MNDTDFREIDTLLRNAVAAPIPQLSADFDTRLQGNIQRWLDRDSRVLSPYRRGLLAAYGVASAAISLVVLRAQGLDWMTTALLVLSPCALLAALPLLGRKAVNR